MGDVSTAFLIASVITGICLIGIAFDSSMYAHLPRGRAKWLGGLLVATILFAFVATLTNGKRCNDYTTNEYKYGSVPISCPAQLNEPKAANYNG